MIDRLDAIRRESEVFYAVAAEADPARRVAACPDWSIADLVWHLCEVQWFWGTVIEQRVPDEAGLDKLVPLDRPERDDEVVHLGRTNLERLIALLDSTDDATRVWTWAPQQDVGFIRRHQVQEAAVHRWDIQAAAGTTPSPIEPEAASDSIDEFLTIQVPFAVSDATPLSGTVHFHCTDTAGEWFIHPNGRVEPIHAKGDVAVRGPASDLLLALYRRAAITNLDVIGDGSIAQELATRIDLS